MPLLALQTIVFRISRVPIAPGATLTPWVLAWPGLQATGAELVAPIQRKLSVDSMGWVGSTRGMVEAEVVPVNIYHLEDEMKQNAIQRARSESTQTLGKYKVLKKEHMDGVKFFLDAPTNGNGAEAWALFRASGTEHLLRLYTEASSKELVHELLVTGEQFVRSSA